MTYFGTSDTNEITRRYLDSILIEERLIDSVVPDLSVEIFGRKYASPIMTPAFSHLHSPVKDEKNGMTAYSRAARNVGVLNWVGMESNESLADILATGADTVRIIKPYADKNKILDHIKFAEENGCAAVGIDIDHIFGGNGQYDIVAGEAMSKVTAEDIKEYVNFTKLPFVIKGVLSVTEAVKCAECGVKGIVVSHHHGRLQSAVPPLMVLPKIKTALKDSSITIFVDCHIDSSADAFKALALGANAVLVGRALLDGINSDGAAGAEKKLRQMNEELAMAMGFTGFQTIDEINSSVLWNV